MATNAKVPFFVTQAAHGLLAAAACAERPAKVIMTSSIDGIAVNRWEAYPYHASKAALVHLARKLAAHLAANNIVMSGIAPRAFASDLNDIARDYPDWQTPDIPVRRIGLPADIAGAAVFLASDADNYVVGDALLLDGGVAPAKMH